MRAPAATGDFHARLISPLDSGLLDIVGGIDSVTLDASSTFTPTALCFTHSSISINLNGQSATRGAVMLSNIDQGGQIPEPASLALVGLALAAAGVARRRAA